MKWLLCKLSPKEQGSKQHIVAEANDTCDCSHDTSLPFMGRVNRGKLSPRNVKTIVKVILLGFSHYFGLMWVSECVFDFYRCFENKFLIVLFTLLLCSRTCNCCLIDWFLIIDFLHVCIITADSSLYIHDSSLKLLNLSLFSPLAFHLISLSKLIWTRILNLSSAWSFLMKTNAIKIRCWR